MAKSRMYDGRSEEDELKTIVVDGAFLQFLLGVFISRNHGGPDVASYQWRMDDWMERVTSNPGPLAPAEVALIIADEIDHDREETAKLAAQYLRVSGRLEGLEFARVAQRKLEKRLAARDEAHTRRIGRVRTAR